MKCCYLGTMLLCVTSWVFFALLLWSYHHIFFLWGCLLFHALMYRSFFTLHFLLLLLVVQNDLYEDLDFERIVAAKRSTLMS